MEKLLDLLKLFLEKHLIPAAVSAAIALLITAYTPQETMLYMRLGQSLYILFLFCLTFAVVKFIIWMTKVIIKKINKAIDNKQEKENELEILWDIIDDLSISEKRMITQFLNTKNTPVRGNGQPWRNSYLYISSELEFLIDSTSVPRMDDVKNTENNAQQKYGYNVDLYPDIMYKLKENYYKLLRYSYKKYGRISHFKMEEETNG